MSDPYVYKSRDGMGAEADRRPSEAEFWRRLRVRDCYERLLQLGVPVEAVAPVLAWLEKQEDQCLTKR